MCVLCLKRGPLSVGAAAREISICVVVVIVEGCVVVVVV